MRAVDFHYVESGRVRARSRPAPSFGDRAYLLARKRAWQGRTFVRRQGARRDQLPRIPIVDWRIADRSARQGPAAFPWTLDSRLAAGVAELDTRRRPALMHEIGDAGERRHECVVPETEIADRAAAAALDLGGLQDHQPRAPGRVATRVHQMPVGGKALDRGILVHGRDHNAVPEREPTDAKWCEQQGQGHDVNSTEIQIVRS